MKHKVLMSSKEVIQFMILGIKNENYSASIALGEQYLERLKEYEENENERKASKTN